MMTASIPPVPPPGGGSMWRVLVPLRTMADFPQVSARAGHGRPAPAVLAPAGRSSMLATRRARMRLTAGSSRGRFWRAAVAASGLVVALSLAACGSSGSSSPVSGPDRSPECRNHPGCLSPQQLRVAYGIEPLLDRGIEGRDQTVVIVDPAVSRGSAGTSDINQDLTQYDRRFDLPSARLGVVSSLAGPGPSSLATQEEVLDVETVHAVAPGAAIRVVLYADPQRGSPATALALYVDSLRYAVDQNLGDVISLSEIIGEDCFTSAQIDDLHAVLRSARDHHVSVVAGSGDFGAADKPCGDLVGNNTSFTPLKEVGLPASDPLVTAVGGTTLDVDPSTGKYVSETAWNTPASPASPSPSNASGGGFSRFFARPSYQNGIPGTSAQRGIPDVAADADPASGLALVTERKGITRIGAGGGTSASAPLWAGLAALADQYADRRLGFLNAALYRIGTGPYYAKAFHDITTGTNTVTFSSTSIIGYQAANGWDPVTGWGSPDAQVLIPLLAREIHPGDGQGL